MPTYNLNLSVLENDRVCIRYSCGNYTCIFLESQNDLISVFKPYGDISLSDIPKLKELFKFKEEYVDTIKKVFYLNSEGTLEICELEGQVQIRNLNTDEMISLSPSSRRSWIGYKLRDFNRYKKKKAKEQEMFLEIFKKKNTLK